MTETAAKSVTDSNGKTATTGRQAERSRHSTNALLTAAGELIVEGGYEAMTLAAVGERAGFSRGLVTTRFGSKAGLLEALIDQIVHEWGHRKVLPDTRGKLGLDGLLIMIDAIRQQAARDSSGVKVLYALAFEALTPNADLKSRFAVLHEEMRNDVSSFIRRGLRDGSMRKGIKASAEAILIVAELRGIGYQWLLDPEHIDPAAALSHLKDVVRARLATDDRD
jgi:AcrR family transcriptional regulator